MTPQELAESVRRNVNRSSARPRSHTRAYAARFEYLPSEDRVEIRYVYPNNGGDEVLVVSEDPLEGLEVHTGAPIDVGPREVLRDMVQVRSLLFPESIGRVPAAQLDRVLAQLKELDALL